VPSERAALDSQLADEEPQRRNQEDRRLGMVAQRIRKPTPHIRQNMVDRAAGAPAAAGSPLFSSADAALVDLLAVHRPHHNLHARGHLTVQGVEQRPDRRQRLRRDDLEQRSPRLMAQLND
jgi:hypothetical protein